jgi:hypothetical protein
MPISLYVGLVLVATGPKEFSVFSVYRFAADVDQTKIRTPGKESSPTTQATSAQLLTARSTSADMAPSHHHSDRHFAFGMQQATGCGATYPGAPFVHSTNAYVDVTPLPFIVCTSCPLHDPCVLVRGYRAYTQCRSCTLQ